jgi:hypothetical protein
MDGRIAQLRCRYRVVTPHTSANQLAARLDRIAGDALMRACASAMERELGADDRVYVLRRVAAPLALAIDGSVTDEQLARRWGERVADAVARARHSGEALVSFADQSEYVARFAADLAGGQAWKHWYYIGFSALRSMAAAEAIGAVLREHQAELPTILAYLLQFGRLDAVLSVLDPPSTRRVWADLLNSGEIAAPEALRPLFAAALRLADALDLWAATPDAERLFHTYIETHPRAADWRDRGSLAQGIVAALRFLQRRGYLRPIERAGAVQVAARLDAALAAIDWADTAILQAHVLSMLDAPAQLRIALPQLTPRQHELLADLAVAGAQLKFDTDHPDSPANALRLYAALVAHAPRWAGDPLTSAVIQALLDAWAWLWRGQAAEALAWLQQGDLARACEQYPIDLRAEASRALALVAAFGAPALALIERFGGQPGGAGVSDRPVIGAGQADRPTSAQLSGAQTTGAPEQLSSHTQRAAWEGCDSACAGIFLLLRAALDLRLVRLVAEAGFSKRGDIEPLPALLLALAMHWAGTLAWANGRIDHGLSLFAGQTVAPTLLSLRTALIDAGRATWTGFQAALLNALAGLRLLRGNELHVRRIMLDGIPALVAGDPAADVWPLGSVLGTAADTSALLARWASSWEHATGDRPLIVVDDADVLELLQQAGAGGTLVELRAADPNVRLPEALSVLGYGALGEPATDLALALAANALLRIWARWLPRFASASTPYLLAQFVRRPGRIFTRSDGLLVELAPLPLDVVLELAGYLDTLEQSLWPGHGRIQFGLRGS